MIFDIMVPFREPNIMYVNFRTWEASFLAGVAAARTTQTGTIGVVGAWDGPPIWGFAAGFEAGARVVDPDIVVLTEYLGECCEDQTVFVVPAKAEGVARSMYERGADVVFAVAGTSGLGVFKASAAMSRPGQQLWTIGVDSDQFVTVNDLTGVTEADLWSPHILTSVLKRYDLVVEDALADLVAGTLSSDLPPPDLASGGVDISYSGGFIDQLKPEIDAYRKQIVDGSIVVPCIPDDRLTVVDEVAAEEGVTPEEVIAVMCP
jgi:basic membrane protein A